MVRLILAAVCLLLPHTVSGMAPMNITVCSSIGAADPYMSQMAAMTIAATRLHNDGVLPPSVSFKYKRLCGNLINMVGCS